MELRPVGRSSLMRTDDLNALSLQSRTSACVMKPLGSSTNAVYQKWGRRSRRLDGTALRTWPERKDKPRGLLAMLAFGPCLERASFYSARHACLGHKLTLVSISYRIRLVLVPADGFRSCDRQLDHGDKSRQGVAVCRRIGSAFLIISQGACDVFPSLNPLTARVFT